MRTRALIRHEIHGLLGWLAVAAVVGTSEAQITLPTQLPVPSQAPSSGASDYTVAQVGPHSRLWRNSAGQSVTEIATGMNFWSGQQWTPSDPSFEVSADGTSFVASKIQDPTRLAANINSIGAVTVTTPDNVTLRSTPIAIGLYDAASGLSVIVAAITNSTGVLVDPQHVVYNHAFVGGGFAASVLYSLPDTGSFHQDVVFTGFDPGFDPTVWGFAAASTNTLQIQIFTEFYGNPPQPQMVERPLYVEQNPAVRASMASPDFIDYTIDFGDYVFGPGRVHTTSTNAWFAGGVTVAKDFVTSSGRTFLVESIPYRRLAGYLRSLPPATVRTSSLKPVPHARKTMVAAASLPPLRGVTPGAVEKINPSKTAGLVSEKPRGVAVDYVVTVSGTGPTLFSSDTTYYVSGDVYLAGPATMENAVFKYQTNNTNETGYIFVESSLTLATTNFRAAVFTAADDNTAGATLSTNIWSGYTGNPSGKVYGQSALCLVTTENISLNNLRFCYMYCAVLSDADTSGQTLTLSHSQLVDCFLGIYVNGGNGSGGGAATLEMVANNCLLCGVGLPFAANTIVLTGNAHNCTFDYCSDLFYNLGSTTGSFGFTNSIFSSLSSVADFAGVSLAGGNNGFYNCGSSTFGTSPLTVYSSPYQSAGAGNYYLASGSPFLTNGTANIDPALLAQLQMKTTQPPMVLDYVIFTANTVLAPVAQRDTTGLALGFHYDPIDYIGGCGITNATLLLTNGVVLAYYDNYLIWLQDGSQLISQGTPTQRNYIVYYNLVQEEPWNLWGVSNSVAQSLPFAPSTYGSSAEPSIILRLTTICAPTGETNLWHSGDFATGRTISGLTLQDCEVYGAGANWQMNESANTPDVGFTNNVFYRVPFAINSNAKISSFNNLFYGTTNTNAPLISIQYRNGAPSPNTNENDVFDGVTASLDGVVGYNAYLNGATNLSYTNNNDIWTNLTWQVGPLGNYYQATNSLLLTNGSTFATNLGLYHYTVMTNEAVEGTNIVSRGYHYVALGANGLPVSTPGDGIPDYLADANGNGIVDAAEISWTNYVSPDGLTLASGLLVFTPLK